MPMKSKNSFTYFIMLLLIHFVSSNAGEKKEDIILYESNGLKLTHQPLT